MEPMIANRLKEDQALVDNWLHAFTESQPEYGKTREAMAYSLFSGGKRIRPALVLAFCRLFGGDAESALPFAGAIEMLHTASLIHDDLPCMDDDDLRRGRPTSHKVYGEALAVIAGDALFIAPFEAIAMHGEPEKARRAAACLARAGGGAGMCAGQVLDLDGEGKSLSYDEISEIQRLKTGCIIEAAARLGCIAAGSTPEQEEAAASYARKVGLAFQIRDDILDITGDEAKLGKPIGSDEENNKSTFVALKGLEACDALTRELTAQAVAKIADMPGSEYLCGLAEALAVRDR